MTNVSPLSDPDATGSLISPNQEVLARGRRISRYYYEARNVELNTWVLPRCVEAIAEDLSAEIRQLNRQPPSPEMAQLIEEQLDALKQVSEEQKDGRSSSAESPSSFPESTISTSPSSSSFSYTASSFSTTVEPCSATYTGQADDEDDAPNYRWSLFKDRRHSPAVLIRRKKGTPRWIDTIGDVHVQFFPLVGRF
ncbi:MAG: hypothetical protein Q9185_004069 [Variospora sp. 1 TL-2023]